MKILKTLGLGACMSLAALTASARADTFTGTFSETYNTNTEGLQIGAQSLQADSALSFALNPGQSISVDLFQIYTPETTVNGDDTVAQTISTLFDFSGPNTASGTVSGSTVGVRDTDANAFIIPGNHQYGQVTWSSPSTISFSNGDMLQVALNDTRFNEGEYYALNYGSFPYSGDAESNGAPIVATFTLEGAAPPISAAPEPADWALMMVGVGAMGAVLRHRKTLGRLPAV